MSVKPILFNTDMVRAILDGRKTVTRLVIKPQPIHENGFWKLGDAGWSDNIKKLTPIPCHSLYNRMPYQTGDYMYVRETWAKVNCLDCVKGTTEKCDCYGFPEINTKDINARYVYKCGYKGGGNIKWHPSIHMPKEAARIWLKVTDVRVERLQRITPRDIIKEGIQPYIHQDGSIHDENKKTSFIGLWNSAIKEKDLDEYGWDANPWVWVIEFERTVKPE